MNNTERIVVEVSFEDKEIIREAAKANRLTLSAYARVVLLSEAIKTIEEKKGEQYYGTL